MQKRDLVNRGDDNHDNRQQRIERTLACGRIRSIRPFDFAQGKPCPLSSSYLLTSSIVIATSQNSDFVFKYLIHQTMLAIYVARSATRQLVFQRLGLTDALRWIALHRLDEFDDA